MCFLCATDPMKKPDHHYSGDRSASFWKRVGKLNDVGDHSAMYSLGCVLQNLEEYVLRQLRNAESKQGKK